MKTFSVAVAVAVMLTFICVQESSAAPKAQGHEMEKAKDSSVPANMRWIDTGADDWRKVEPVAVDIPVTFDEEIPVESWRMPYEIRQRRRKCRFCCGCCPRMIGCGVCCRF